MECESSVSLDGSMLMRGCRGLMIARGLAVNGAKVWIGGRRKDVIENVSGKIGELGGEILS